jgi:uroporphyrinogen-III synthase
MAASPRLLVTRPDGQQGALCRQLEEAGFSVCHQPLLELQAIPALSPAQRQLVLDLDRYQHVIFVSANAIRFGMAWIQSLWPQLPPALNWYAVGAASAALLREHGLSPLMPQTSADSEGLLERPELLAVSGERVLLVRGAGGRTLLRQTLQARGARVAELECYHRRCPSLAAGRMAQIVAACQMVLLSSGEGLDNMLSLLSPAETTKLRHTPLVVPSRRVAEMAAAAGFDRVVRATSAADEAMLQAVAGYWHSAGEIQRE